ncbi:MAG TPA: DMT family transporter, partial [Jatrophihabitans sp.]|nr:DMT family transporter [Jatrophihabitans sp.]
MTATVRDRTGLVAAAAALWGLDGLLRKPLATALNPATVVLWEHVIVAVLVAPVIPAAVRAFARCSWRDRVAIAVIGVAASATATALFTEAFRLAAGGGDFIGPLVMQKLQPMFAVVLAAALVGERMRRGFVLYALPALVGSWMLAFPQPTHVRVAEAAVALFSVGAALLWALGTVLGRLVSSALTPREITVLRYLWGLLGAVAIVGYEGAPWTPGWGNMTGLLLLALIPGLISLVVYYVGLRGTAAMRATFAELAFPATAAIVGVLFLNSRLSGWQWCGLGILLVAV